MNQAIIYEYEISEEQYNELCKKKLPIIKSGEFYLNKSILEEELKPICFICQKEVEEIEREFNFYNMNHMIKVKCHGDEDNMSISKYDMEDMKYNVSKGYAFTNKRLDTKEMCNETQSYI